MNVKLKDVEIFLIIPICAELILEMSSTLAESYTGLLKLLTFLFLFNFSAIFVD